MADEAAERERRRKNAVTRDANLDVRDIGTVPEVVNPERRGACANDLRLFLETYFPKTFRLGWAPSHFQLIDAVQNAVHGGGLQAIGYPRGSGKTSICERSVIWAVLNNHSLFGMLFTAEATKSAQRLKSIKMELLTNDLLLEDFPEVCYPIKKSEGIANRANHQLCCGNPTHLKWGASEILLPFTPQSVELGTSGAVIGVGTITGAASRGPLVTLPTGESRRPDLILIDDPQTRTSAKSPLQVQERLDTITGDMLGMAGPDRALAALLTCTPIFTDDLADQILDPEKFPDWNGIRVPMLQSWPVEEAMALWGEWNDVRIQQSIQQAHEFYSAHRVEMDAGAETYWSDRTFPGFLSSLESAMFLWYRSPATFMSEFQCQPEDKLVSDVLIPSVDQLLTKASGTLRGRVPSDANHLTAFIDVQRKTLWYTVAAFREDFTGYVVDWGVYPDQHRRYYTKTDCRRTYDLELPGAGQEAALENALKNLVELLSEDWERDDGQVMRISKGFIDANDGNVTDAVYSFMNRSKLAPVWLPSHGLPVTATQAALTDGKKKPGEQYGLNWRLTNHPSRRMRRMQFDASWWKTFVAERWSTASGDPGSLFIPGVVGRHDTDPMVFVDHQHSEFATKVEAKSKGRELLQWELKPGRDNEYFDGIVGCHVAASVLGCQLASVAPCDAPRRRHTPLTQDRVEEFYGG